MRLPEKTYAYSRSHRFFEIAAIVGLFVLLSVVAWRVVRGVTTWGQSLIVLAVVVGLYVQHAMTYLSTRQEAHRDAAVVQRLTRDNAALMSTQRLLQDPATIEKTARALGMIKPGERPYVITGLPKK